MSLWQNDCDSRVGNLAGVNTYLINFIRINRIKITDNLIAKKLAPYQKIFPGSFDIKIFKKGRDIKRSR